MQLQTKNIQFTRLLKADGRLREFNFRKMGGAQEAMFSVDVVDDRGNRIMFHMHKENNAWKIAEPDVPAWVTQNEDQLDKSIEGVY